MERHLRNFAWNSHLDGSLPPASSHVDWQELGTRQVSSCQLSMRNGDDSLICVQTAALLYMHMSHHLWWTSPLEQSSWASSVAECDQAWFSTRLPLSMHTLFPCPSVETELGWLVFLPFMVGICRYSILRFMCFLSHLIYRSCQCFLLFDT